MSVRVRYAPSPTGLQHIGGLRTALFNYFFARSRDGVFILRVEDTDRERFDPAALEDLYETFRWLDIAWDEGPEPSGGDRGSRGPYVQSDRVRLHQEHALRLVESGHAYFSYEDPTAREAPYEGANRRQNPDEVRRLEDAGIKPVVRFLRPDEGATVLEDMVLGTVKRKHKDVPMDPVLLKSDGFPTYHLANVVDDHHMGITHVMRAQEWIPSAPLHLLLYQAFGWEPPTFCHLPMVLGKDGQKLSKRHGATSVAEFRRQGYLPEALVNYVALLGWSYDDSREFFSRGELEELFDPAKLGKAPAVFDYKKLDWFNGSYIRRRPAAEIRDLVLPYLRAEGLVSDPPTSEELSVLDGAMPLVHERLKLLSDAPDLLRFLYIDAQVEDLTEAVPKKATAREAADYLQRSRDAVAAHRAATDEDLEEIFRVLAEERSVKLGDLLTPLRVAITASRVSLPLFASIRLLGTDEALRRIDRLIDRLHQHSIEE